MDIQIDQKQMNNQQYIQVVPNEIITQENNGHVQNLNDLHQVVQLNQMQMMNQMNYSQNDQVQANDRKRNKEITIADTEALNGLTEKINKLADKIGLLIQAQNESLKAQKESNQNQAKLLDLLTKKFFPLENEKAPLIDNDQSKINLNLINKNI